MSIASESQINFTTCDGNALVFLDLASDDYLKGELHIFFARCRCERWCDVKSFLSEVNSLPLLSACVCRLQFVISDICQNMFFLKSARHDAVCRCGASASCSWILLKFECFSEDTVSLSDATLVIFVDRRDRHLHESKKYITKQEVFWDVEDNILLQRLDLICRQRTDRFKILNHTSTNSLLVHPLVGETTRNSSNINYNFLFISLFCRGSLKHT